MKVYVDTVVTPHILAGTVRDLAGHSVRHQLADTPEEAELVLLCGPFARRPERLLEHPLMRSFGGRCAVYTEDDSYSPLVPGVYTSPRRGLSTRIGRVRSHAFATSYGGHANDEVRRAATEVPGRGRPEPDLLCSFEGTASSRLRRHLLSMAVDPHEALITDTTRSYGHFDHARAGRLEGQRRYVETMQRSRFVLCPKGVGTGTLRLFEAMSLGVAPVLLSDRYVLPRGPRWEEFLVQLPERRLERVVPMLRARASESEERGRAARSAWDVWFAPEVLFDRIVDAAVEALGHSPRLEPAFRLAVPITVARFRLERRAREGLSALRRRASA